MKLFIDVVRDINSLARVQNAWNEFVIKHCDNPFLLCKFIEMYAIDNYPHWTPQIIIGENSGEIVGLAPLMSRDLMGIRLASFIMPPENSPEFLVEEQFKIEFINRVFNYLFENLKCKIVHLTFPSESEYLHLLREICRTNKIKLFEQPISGRRVLYLNCSWEEYEKFRGSDFRRRFRKMQNKLNTAGSWRVISVEKGKNDVNTFQNIVQIEKLSWKHYWRYKHKKGFDRDLKIFWKAAEELSVVIPEFKRVTWFLELENRPIAYAIIFQFKNTAFIAKTSYNERYKKYYPGMYLIHSIIRDLFINSSVKKIDFMTDMSFMDAWTRLCLGRVRVFTVKGVLQKMALYCYCNNQLKTLINKVLLLTKPRGEN